MQRTSLQILVDSKKRKSLSVISCSETTSHSRGWYQDVLFLQSNFGHSETWAFSILIRSIFEEMSSAKSTRVKKEHLLTQTQTQTQTSHFQAGGIPQHQSILFNKLVASEASIWRSLGKKFGDFQVCMNVRASLQMKRTCFVPNGTITKSYKQRWSATCNAYGLNN